MKTETTTHAPTLDRVAQIMAYEAGELEEPEMIELFQSLVDDGTAWLLQGHYGRTAAALIAAGMVHDPRARRVH